MRDISNEEYRKSEGVSRSELFQLMKSPKHFKYAIENPSESTPALVFGAAAHKYILEEDSFFDEFDIAPECDRRTKEGKQIWADFIEQSEGKQIISKEEYETILAMQDAIKAHPIANMLVYNNENEREQSIFWTDNDTGEKVKVRPDILTTWGDEKYICDYKTTDSCEDGHFERACRKYGYKLQAGMYREGVFNEFFEQYQFAFIAQEKKAPYAVRIYVCSEDFMDEGLDQYRALIGLYHECKQSGNWFGYEGENAAEFEILKGDFEDA